MSFWRLNLSFHKQMKTFVTSSMDEIANIFVKSAGSKIGINRAFVVIFIAKKVLRTNFTLKWPLFQAFVARKVTTQLEIWYFGSFCPSTNNWFNFFPKKSREWLGNLPYCHRLGGGANCSPQCAAPSTSYAKRQKYLSSECVLAQNICLMWY